MERPMDRRASPGGLILAAFLLAVAPTALRGQVVINEVMADNATTLLNEDTYPDWVELYNTAAQDVNIGGWFLTDNATNISKFRFPNPTMIRGNQTLVVFCDSETNAPGLHTGFKLAKEGGFVGLYASGIHQDSVIYGLQVTDYSIGRVPDGTGDWVLNRPTPESNNVAATLAVRAGNLFINEWVATNTLISGTNVAKPDWLELYNAATNPVRLSGLVFTTYDPPVSVANKPITNLSFIGPQSFIKFDCVGRGDAKKNDELDFKLSHQTGEKITLFGGDGVTILDQVTYPGNNTIPNYWAIGVSYGRLPDGSTNGYLVDPNFPYAGSTNWARFPSNRTTPAASNFLPLTNVVINEVLAHTDPPFEDAIELFNPTPNPVDIGGYWISNSKDYPKKFRVPFGTILPPYGFTNFYECVGCTPCRGFNCDGTGNAPFFTFNSARGDAVYIFSANAAGDLTGFRTSSDFDSSPNGVSFGRYRTSEGKYDFVLMSRTTFGVDNPATVFEFRQGKGQSNAYPRISPLVISEIHYHPPDIVTPTNTLDDSLNEFVELYNASPNPVRLWDTNGLYYAPGYPPWNTTPYADGRTNTWRIRGDIGYEFPTNVTVPPGGFLLLVNFDPVTNLTQLAEFTTRFAVPLGVPIFGPYRGKLANSKAQVELKQADTPQGPQHPDFRYVPYYPMDKVNYADDPPWPTNADGRGMSLNRIKVEEYGNDPTNWVALPPSPGRQHLRIEPLQVSGNPRQVKVRFHAWAGASYTVQYKDSLGATGPWSRLTNFPAQSTSGVREVIDAALPPGSNRFYRVICPQQP